VTITIKKEVQEAFLREAASPEHQNLVKGMIAYLESQGWKITHAAGIDNYPQPDPVEDRIPDLVARKDGMKAYGEAERCEMLNSNDTLDQLQKFSGRTLTQGDKKTSIPLYVCVPEDCFTELKQIIAQPPLKGREILPLCQPKQKPKT
jgi:hypothetical protein